MKKNRVCWLHFGDLHIFGENERNYLDFLELIGEANNHLTEDVDFAYLPGDNADDGEEGEYVLVQRAVKQLCLPIHAIPGDHDAIGDGLRLFQRYLSPYLYKSFSVNGYHFVCLNSVAVWKPPVFDLGHEQLEWLRNDLEQARSRGERTIFLMHAYPSEHGESASQLHSLMRQHRVLMVDMGHTHYNELANDAHAIYATTRSTGQIEEGGPGFSVVSIENDCVSWKFKPIGEWPLVMITSPADRRLITNRSAPNQVVRGVIELNVHAWGPSIEELSWRVDGAGYMPMIRKSGTRWSAVFDATTLEDGIHCVEVQARCEIGRTATDKIEILVNQRGSYDPPPRAQPDYENVVGSWLEKHILGTQLGPNENGHGWPRRSKNVTPEPAI